MDFHFIWYPDISAKVCSSSSVIALYFSCSPTSASSRRSTSVCNFCTERSENSALASACFNLAERGLICSLWLASLWLAFSSETSRDLRLLATTLNSSSNSTILISPTSALSSALSSSPSTCCNLFATSSYFLSASSAWVLAPFSSSSSLLILSSSWIALLSSTFLIRSLSSAAVAALSSFWVAKRSLSSHFSRSSSSP